MTSKQLLVMGDGVVAKELTEAYRALGYSVDGYVHEGPIDLRKMDRLNGELMNYWMTDYHAVVLAFTSEREVWRRVIETLEIRVSKHTLVLVSAMAQSATEIASWFDHPERVVGFGFLPPLSGVKALEVARAYQSEERAFAQATKLLEELGKEIAVVKDSAGLVLPRLVSMIVNEAVTALTEGVASASDIDTAMKLGTNYPHGPLAWADVIGLDQVYATLQGVYEEQGEDRYRPAPQLRRMVLAKQLGRRVGRGFYTYETGEGVEE